MTTCFHMASIFADIVQKVNPNTCEVHSRELTSTTLLTGYVHTLDQGNALFITDERKPYLITLELVLFYHLKTGDHLRAEVEYSSEYENYVVTKVLDVQHVNYDLAQAIKSTRSFSVLGNAIQSGTSVLIPANDNTDIANKIAQIQTELPNDIVPMLLSFDGRSINFDVPTAYFTKPTYSNREKLMTCLLTFFRAKQQADRGKQVVVMIDSLDKMFLTFNGCMQPAGLIDPNLYSSAAVMDYENLLCSSNQLKAGGSLTIIGLHRPGISPQLLQITDRLNQIMDTVLKAN